MEAAKSQTDHPEVASNARIKLDLRNARLKRRGVRTRKFKRNAKRPVRNARNKEIPDLIVKRVYQQH